MNKTKKSALGAAGVGVVALAMLGGGTFAAWSDFDTIDENRTEAGHLVLDLKGTDPISNVGWLQPAIAPGEYRTVDYFIASADLEGVPKASLTFNLQNLVDEENGCSSRSEKAVDSNCGDTTDPGEFVDQAYVNVSYSKPTRDNIFIGGSCRGENLTESVPVSSLNDLTTPVELGDLRGGQGVCVRFEIGLPFIEGDQNASQGDSASFDIRWDLTQKTPED
ncbi:hypothetical protein HJG43_12395 [Kineosporiaceae bacterium SCSIO 59966]|nr:hypothetical protein HJG43_12395 [Kineosporiaceae bacterium SCSIO 59966]